MQNWDKILFPRFLATIRGQKYLTLSDEQLYDELNNLTLRAITAFKFPRISLNYSVQEKSTVDNNDEICKYLQYSFDNDIGVAEINVLISWMKYYWYEMLISNSDNYQNLYFDSNIKTYSPGNLISAFEKSRENALKDARSTEINYGRVNESGTPSIGDINE